MERISVLERLLQLLRLSFAGVEIHVLGITEYSTSNRLLEKVSIFVRQAPTSKCMDSLYHWECSNCSHHGVMLGEALEI